MRLVAGFAALVLAACATAPAPQHRIEEASYLSIGGIEQYVTIRGDDDRKPILLFVHGGPGDAQSGFVKTYAPYERDFVLVQWDQRGSAHTFARSGGKTPNFTANQVIDDGVALAGQLRARFPYNRLVLMGHSWGTVIATGMAQKQPKLFDAYVGTGQIASWAAGVQFQFDLLKGEARRANDATLLAALEAIGKPDPTNVNQYFTSIARPLRQHMAASDTGWLTNLKARALSDGQTEADIQASGDGQSASGAAFIQAIVHEDLESTATRFAMPYCVIQGAGDVSTPTAPAKAYFDKVTAPKKKFAVIENAGHFALVTHTAEVIAALKACPGV